MTYHRCKTCNDDLDLGHNWTDAMKSAHRYVCKPCWNRASKAYNAAYRAANRDKASDYTRQWRMNNPEKYQAQLEKRKQDRLRKKLEDAK